MLGAYGFDGCGGFDVADTGRRLQSQGPSSRGEVVRLHIITLAPTAAHARAASDGVDPASPLHTLDPRPGSGSIDVLWDFPAENPQARDSGSDCRTQVQRGGASPEEWARKTKGRFPVCHVKDMAFSAEKKSE